MKKTKVQNVNNEQNESKELIEAINQIAKDKDISKETLFAAVENALLAACKNEFGKDNGKQQNGNDNGSNSSAKVDNIKVFINRETGKIDVLAEKTIVKEVNDKNTEITLEEAEKLYPNGKFEYDDKVNVVVTPKNFMRISAQKAKQAVVQKIREEERKVIFNQFAAREHEIVSGIIQHINEKNNQLICTINLGKTDAILAENEMIPGERLSLNERIKVYVVEVKESSKGPRITVSRSNKEFVKRLFEQEVTEVSEGIVEIKSIAREAGYRTKIAVYSSDPDVDPVGACVGLNGERVGNIVNELNGEKIDIIAWNENPAIYIENALSPAKVISVDVDPDSKFARVIVPDSQQSLAIGGKGQNSRLAAKLTGYKIDIKSESDDQSFDSFSFDDDDFYIEDNEEV